MQLLLLFLRQLSIGRKFLSIDSDGFVPEDLKNREAWWLMILATIFVLDGTKQMVRWAQQSAFPIFGFILNDAQYVLASFLLGGLSVLAGYWIYKLDIRGWFLTLGLTIFNISSFLFSGSELVNKAIANKVYERRTIQGTSIRTGEIEIFQQMIFPAVMIFGGVTILVLLYYRKRFVKK